MANALNPLPSFIRASAYDAANMSMRKEGRSKWNDDDWNLMCETQERLIKSCYGHERDHNEPNWCYIRFSVAERLEKAGSFKINSDMKTIHAIIEETLA